MAEVAPTIIGVQSRTRFLGVRMVTSAARLADSQGGRAAVLPRRVTAEPKDCRPSYCTNHYASRRVPLRPPEIVAGALLCTSAKSTTLTVETFLKAFGFGRYGLTLN
jgi:hypothetical protein